MDYAAPDGYGRYGILDTTDDGLLICHECGRPCRHLATHARLAHGIAVPTVHQRLRRYPAT